MEFKFTVEMTNKDLLMLDDVAQVLYEALAPHMDGCTCEYHALRSFIDGLLIQTGALSEDVPDFVDPHTYTGRNTPAS